MFYLRLALFAILVVLCLFVVYQLSSYDSEYETNLALDYFSKGNDQEARTALDKAKSDLDPAQYYLFSSYIDRQKDLNKSDRDLAKALEYAKKNQQSSGILLEIYLNQALNAYLADDPEDMKISLEKAKSIAGASNDWVAFFYSLYDSLSGNYVDALKIWQRGMPHSNLSMWMRKSYERLFTSNWYFIHRTKASIEEGDYFDVRQKLEEMSGKASDTQLEDIEFLLGLSYIKEASEKPISAATPYYELAFSYFNRIPILNDRFKQEREEILKTIVLHIEKMLKEHLYDDLSFYTPILEKWKDQTAIEPLQHKLQTLLDQQITAKNWEAAQQISKGLSPILINKNDRQAIQNKFETLIKNAIQEGPATALDNYLEMTLLLSSNPVELKRRISLEIEEQILFLIPTDAPDLNLTMPYISFWNKMAKESPDRLTFAMELIDLGKVLWIQQNQPEKAFHLFIQAAAIPTNGQERQFLNNIFIHQLKDIYAIALKNNNVSSLKELLLAKQELQLPALDFHEKETLSQQLEEAQAFFNQGLFEEALRKTAWVLELEPDNQTALAIAGQIEYQQANYEEALHYLKNLKKQNRDVKTALTVSEIILGNAQEEQDLVGNSSIYERLGFGTLIRNKPQKSLKWFKLIPNPNVEARTGMAYALFKIGQWKQALDEYSELPASIREMDGMRGMDLNIQLSLGNSVEAEKILHAILEYPENRSQSNINTYSAPFLAFKTSVLDPQTPDFIAGLYYKDVKHDNETALDYFRKVNPAAPQVLAEMGSLFYTQGKYLEAIEAFTKALEQAGQSKEIKQRILPLLADAFSKVSYWIESAQTYTDYFNTFPGEMKLRSAYAKVLMENRLYPQALKQFALLDIAKMLSNEDKVNEIASLIHTDQFNAAIKEASQWLPQMPLSDQLKIAELLIPAHDIDLTREVLKKLPEKGKRPFDVEESLLSYLIVRGDYPQAEEVVKNIQSELEKSFRGLMLLAQLKERVSDQANALKYAEKARLLEPNNPRVLELIDKVNLNVKLIENRIAEIQKALKTFPANGSLQLNLAESYVDTSTLAQKLDPSIKDFPEVYNAYHMLDQLAKNDLNIPRLYFLLGKSAYLLHNNAAALEALKKAIDLDVSYVDAYRYLGLLYANQQEYDKALAAVYKSLHFAPQDAETWFEVAMINLKLDADLDALTALEQVIVYKPNDFDAYLLMAHLKLTLNDPEGAYSALEKALKLKPSHMDALRLMLITLYNPFLVLDHFKSDDLTKMRDSIYQRLHAINPKEAEEMLKKLKNEK